MKLRTAIGLGIACLLLACHGSGEQVTRTTTMGQPDASADGDPRSVEASVKADSGARAEQDVVPLLSGPKIAARGPKTNPYLKQYEFTRDAFTRNLPIWEKALEPYRGRPNLRYLEVGLFEGRSALWMLEQVLTHPSSSLIGMDPFGDPYGVENVEGRFNANLKLSGEASRVEVIKGYSQVELRKLDLESFDIIYIDGSHRAADVLEDAILSYRLLKNDGLLIFDDYLWFRQAELSRRPERAIDIFYTHYGEQFEIVHADYQVFLRRQLDESSEEN